MSLIKNVSLFLFETANSIIDTAINDRKRKGGFYVLVELDDLIVARLQRLAEREGISIDEILENLMALYGVTCD